MQFCSKHSNQQIDIICLESACKSHIACVQCIIEEHADHPDSCLFISDIIQGNLKQENTKIENLIRLLRSEHNYQVNKDFRDIENQMLLHLDCFQDALNNYYNQHTQEEIQEKEKEFLDLLEQQTNNEEIVQLYKQLINGQIDKTQFNTQLNEYLLNPNREAQKQQIINLYKILMNQSLKLQQKDLNQIQTDIQETLLEIPKMLSLEKIVQFQVLQGSKSTVENGNQISICQYDQQAVIVSTTSLQNPSGKVKFTIKVESFDTNAAQQLQVGFAHHSKQMNYNYFYRQNCSVYFGLSNNGRINYSVQKPESKIIGDSIRQALKEKRPANIILSLDITNKQCLLQFEDIKVEYSKKKCSKLGYGGESGAEQFFSKNKKFVMFFTANMGDMKCTVV